MPRLIGAENKMLARVHIYIYISRSKIPMDQLAITIPRSLFRPMLFRSGSMGEGSRKEGFHRFARK